MLPQRTDRLKNLPRSKSSEKLRHLSVHSESAGATAVGASAIGTITIGTLAIGALAIGALAIGALAIGRLSIRRTRMRRVEIDELVVRRLRITDEIQLPDKLEAEKSASARETDPSLRH
jgi:hypothetical protein